MQELKRHQQVEAWYIVVHGVPAALIGVGALIPYFDTVRMNPAFAAVICGVVNLYESIEGRARNDEDSKRKGAGHALHWYESIQFNETDVSNCDR